MNYFKIWNTDLQLVKEYYENRINEFSINSFAALDWRYKKYYKKFVANCLYGVKMEKVETILDLGCGTCELYEYILLNFKKEVYYFGIDIVSEFILFAKNRRPSIDVQVGNYLSKNILPKRTYDMVVNLGGLNSKVRYFEKFLYHTIELMVLKSKRYIIFNIITSINNSYFDMKRRSIGRIHCYEKRKLLKILEKVSKYHNISFKLHDVSIFKGSIDTFVLIQKI